MLIQIAWIIDKIRKNMSSLWIKIFPPKKSPSYPLRPLKDMEVFSKKRKEEKKNISRWESEGGGLNNEKKRNH